MISGRLLSALAFVVMAGVLGTYPRPAEAAGPTVTVTATASDPKGNTLSYAWRVTDGKILSTSGKTMSWQLPGGPGLHFAYVLVANGKGGYTERRVAVNTDAIGTAPDTPAAVTLKAPAAAAPSGNFYTADIRSGYYVPPDSTDGLDNGVYLAGAEAYLKNSSTNAVTSTVKSTVRGFFTVPNVPNGTYDVYCRASSLYPFAQCDTGIVMNNAAAFNPIMFGIPGRDAIAGRLVLADGNPCGVNNEFFGKVVLPKATLQDGSGTALEGPITVNAFGHFSFGQPGGASIKFQCEGVTTTFLLPEDTTTWGSLRVVLNDSAAPLVTGMSAKKNATEVGLFLPPPTGFPSDNVPGADLFLAAKGIDSRLSACRYYVAIGAAKGCTSSGGLTTPVSFDDWKKATKMAPYLETGKSEVVATYINRVDLNLTRRHHSVSYAADRTAAYVCNHLGPANETQAAADTAIDNAIAGKNLVACVAMDYSVTAGVNGGKPFTRFLIFGPGGQLLPSINLDGRTEKFVPGVCVACHGGDKYAGRFPTAAPGTTGAGSANIGAHFLPYDTGNFVFSTKTALTETAQKEQVYKLNQNVLKAGPTTAAKELIAGWYALGHALDKNYLPASWQGLSTTETRYYRKVYASACRTCHVAFTEALNFDHHANLTNAPSPTFEDGQLRSYIAVCGSSSSWLRIHSMPNSLRTFNLFWGSKGTSTDQPSILAAEVGGGSTDCDLTHQPLP